MAIVLRAIESEADGVTTAVVEHGGRTFSALVAGDADRLRAAVGSTLIVEVDFKEVRSSRILGENHPDQHGLFPSQSGETRIVGAVHNIISIPGSTALVDVYFQSGPEFVTFEADTLGGQPEIGAGLEVLVAGLCFCPTWV